MSYPIVERKESISDICDFLWVQVLQGSLYLFDVTGI